MVKPEAILKELSKLWVDLGHEEQQDSSGSAPGAGMLRACAMTLITIADESEDPTNVGETVAMLMKEHPSRSVLVRLRDGAERCLESRVFAQCWMPFGQRRQICCEQIEITASLTSLDDVAGVLLPLAVPDLPVILWVRSPRLFESPAFPAVAALVDKIIVDTAAFPEATEALAGLTTRLGGGRLIADLAWARTTRWRETVSQVFENRECLEALQSCSGARVEFGGAKLRTEPLYLAAWLQNGLRSIGNQTNVELTSGGGPAVTAVSLQLNGRCDVSIRSDSSGAVEVKANKLENRLLFPEATDQLALREELSINTRDAVFEAALPVAAMLGPQAAKA